MKIKQLSIASATTLQFDTQLTHPICLFYGKYADLALDLVREAIGDYGAIDAPDRIDDGRFVLHIENKIDGKTYYVCYIRNADTMGDNRIAVNFEQNSRHFSLDDTYGYQQKCQVMNRDTANTFLSESDRCLLDFREFIKTLSDSHDSRPIFLYNALDRIDQAEIPSILQSLISLKRQIFISSCQALSDETAQNINLEQTEHHNEKS